jgi:poly(beta-D-mannuronate) C5 epimerase
MQMPHRHLVTFFTVLCLCLGVYARFHGTLAMLWKITGGRVSGNYIVSTGPGGARTCPLAGLPDVSGYTVQSIAALAPAVKGGTAGIADMESFPDLREFSKDDGRVQHQRLTHMTVDPRAIVIREGVYDLPRLHKELKDDRLLRRDGDTWLLRLPLLVMRGAALVVSGQELRLSQEEGAFIANSGDLFIVRGKVTGWSEKAAAPAPFQSAEAFRPFINTWSGGRMYVAASTLSYLGYDKGKSYGLSYSTCRYCLDADPGLPPPTGILAGSVFSHMYYGFYSYEAEDVAIVRNTYADNEVYGIDPHDRSRGLIIAGNEAYGSGRKHGIIISRGVRDSWIYGNNSHDNHGSGIMLDRSSVNNVVAGNTMARNKGDGLTFFESPDNVSCRNKIRDNGSSGIRVRNSWNVNSYEDEITGNAATPVVIYAATLDAQDRDMQEDPYVRRAQAGVSGATIRARDDKPAFKIDDAEGAVLSGIRMLSGGPVFADVPDAEQELTITRKTEAAVFLAGIRGWAARITK